MICCTGVAQHNTLFDTYTTPNLLDATIQTSADEEEEETYGKP